MPRLPSGVFSGCNFQHVECLTWLWMYGTGFEVSDLFVLYDPGCEVSDLCVGIYPGCKVTNLFVSVHLRMWALWSVHGCIPLCVRANMFPCVIFLSCLWMCVPECVFLHSVYILSVSLWSVYGRLPRILSDTFPGVYVRICYLYCFCVGKQSPDKKSLICLSLYIPGCNVSEWFMGET